MPPLLLVIKDDPDVLALLVKILTDDGYRVATAQDGEAGLTVARSAKPDLIVLDLMLPRMNALQFRAVQRLDPVLCDVPVICLSRGWGLGPLPVAVGLGTESPYSKPIDLDALLNIVRRYCARD